MVLSCYLYSNLTGNLDLKRRCFDLPLVVNDVSVFIRNRHTDFTGAGHNLDFQCCRLSVGIDRPLLVAIMESVCSTPAVTGVALDPPHLQSGSTGSHTGSQNNHKDHDCGHAATDPDPILPVDLSGPGVIGRILIFSGYGEHRNKRAAQNQNEYDVNSSCIPYGWQELGHQKEECGRCRILNDLRL